MLDTDPIDWMSVEHACMYFISMFVSMIKKIGDRRAFSCELKGFHFNFHAHQKIENENQELKKLVKTVRAGVLVHIYSKAFCRSLRIKNDATL